MLIFTMFDMFGDVFDMEFGFLVMERLNLNTHKKNQQILFKLFKGIVHPKEENSAVIYSVWLTDFCAAQKVKLLIALCEDQSDLLTDHSVMNHINWFF